MTEDQRTNQRHQPYFWLGPSDRVIRLAGDEARARRISRTTTLKEIPATTTATSQKLICLRKDSGGAATAI